MSDVEVEPDQNDLVKEHDHANGSDIGSEGDYAEEGEYEDETDEEEVMVPAFSEEDKAMLRSAFSLFDLDGNGVICNEELGTLLRALGQDPSEEELKELMVALDQNENGVVEFDEFLKLMEERIDTRSMPSDQKDVFREAFKVFDKDENGKISSEELRAAVTSYGKMRLSEQEADDMIKSADVDGDGQINFDEFVSLFTGVNIVQVAAELSAEKD